MNEAKYMHRELMNALLPIVPRAVYRDIRRIVNLAWAIVGLCITHTVRLEAWSEVIESHAQYAAIASRRSTACPHRQWMVCLHY